MKKHILILFILSCLFGNIPVPKLFQYNQSTFQAFYFFKNVMIDSVHVDADDWVGTFNCIKWDADSTSCLKLGTCVGSRLWNTEKCGGGVCDLPAMGNIGPPTEKTKGYMEPGQYPVFLIHDKSKGTYHRAQTRGDVTIQQDVCRNGYPYCYVWENFNFYFVETLNGNDVYMDCSGKLGGSATIDAFSIAREMILLISSSPFNKMMGFMLINDNSLSICFSESSKLISHNGISCSR